MSDNTGAILDFAKTIEMALRNHIELNLSSELRSPLYHEPTRTCELVTASMRTPAEVYKSFLLSGKPLHHLVSSAESTNLTRVMNPESEISQSPFIHSSRGAGGTSLSPMITLDSSRATVPTKFTKNYDVSSISRTGITHSSSSTRMPAPLLVGRDRIQPNSDVRRASLIIGGPVSSCNLSPSIANSTFRRSSLGVFSISHFSAPVQGTAHQPINVLASAGSNTLVTNTSNHCRTTPSVLHYRPQLPRFSTCLPSVPATSPISPDKDQFRCDHCLFTASRIARVHRHMEHRHPHAVTGNVTTLASTTLPLGNLVRLIRFPNSANTVCSAKTLPGPHLSFSSSVSFGPPSNGTFYRFSLPTPTLSTSSAGCDFSALSSKPLYSFLNPPSVSVLPTSLTENPVCTHTEESSPVISVVHSVPTFTSPPICRFSSPEHSGDVSVSSGVWFHEQPTCPGLGENILGSTSVAIREQDNTSVSFHNTVLATPVLCTSIDKLAVTLSVSERFVDPMPISQLIPSSTPVSIAISHHLATPVTTPELRQTFQLPRSDIVKKSSKSKPPVSSTVIILDSSSDDGSCEDGREQNSSTSLTLSDRSFTQPSCTIRDTANHSIAPGTLGDRVSVSDAVVSSKDGSLCTSAPVATVCGPALAVGTDFQTSCSGLPLLATVGQNSPAPTTLTAHGTRTPICSSFSSPVVISMPDSGPHEPYNLRLSNMDIGCNVGTHEKCTVPNDNECTNSQDIVPDPLTLDKETFNQHSRSQESKAHEPLLMTHPIASCDAPKGSLCSLLSSPLASCREKHSSVVQPLAQVITSNTECSTDLFRFAQPESLNLLVGETGKHIQQNVIANGSITGSHYASPEPSCSSLSSPVTISSLSDEDEEEDSAIDTMFTKFNCMRQTARKRLPFAGSSLELTHPESTHLLDHSYFNPVHQVSKIVNGCTAKLPTFEQRLLVLPPYCDYHDPRCYARSDPSSQMKANKKDDAIVEPKTPSVCSRNNRLPLLTARKRSVFPAPSTKHTSRTFPSDHHLSASLSSQVLPTPPLASHKPKRARRKSPIQPLPISVADTIYEPSSPSSICRDIAPTPDSHALEDSIVDLTRDSSEECETSAALLHSSRLSSASSTVTVSQKSTVSIVQDAQSITTSQSPPTRLAIGETSIPLLGAFADHPSSCTDVEEADPSTRIMVDIYTGELFVDNRPLRQLVSGIKVSKEHRSNANLCVTKTRQKLAAVINQKRCRQLKPSDQRRAASHLKHAKHEQHSLRRSTNAPRLTRSHSKVGTDLSTLLPSQEECNIPGGISSSTPLVSGITLVPGTPSTSSG